MGSSIQSEIKFTIGFKSFNITFLSNNPPSIPNPPYPEKGSNNKSPFLEYFLQYFLFLMMASFPNICA